MPSMSRFVSTIAAVSSIATNRIFVASSNITVISCKYLHHYRQSGKEERRHEKARQPEQPQLCNRRLERADHYAQQHALGEERQRPENYPGRPGHAPRQEQVYQERHQQRLLHGVGSLHERKVPAALLKHHCLVNHGEFKVRFRVVNGHPLSFHYQYYEQRPGNGQQRRHCRSSREHFVNVGGAQGERHGGEDHYRYGLYYRGYGHFPW